MESTKDHWNKVYIGKPSTQVSWYEPMPETSLGFVVQCNLDKDSAIIDVGGGDSFLVDFLLSQEYTDVTVLDISEKAIEKVQTRLGERADQVTWIVADICSFKPEKKYSLWHDRAAFHFLTEASLQEKYIKILGEAIGPGGFTILGTFSEKGPESCSGLKVHRYSIAEMQGLFAEGFFPMSCKNIDHVTPSGAIQNFTYCSFKRINP